MRADPRPPVPFHRPAAGIPVRVCDSANRRPASTVARRIALATALATALSACGSDDTAPAPVGADSATDGGHDDIHIETLGRLAVQEAGSADVRIVELDTGAVAATLTMDNPVSALAASPGRRFALAVQRIQDTVQFIDGGLRQEDHGDHLHDYREAPVTIAFRLDGTRPTHVDDHEALTAVFNDGLAAGGIKASVTVLSDASIAAGRPEATLALDMQMHGAAQPLERDLLVTWRAPDNTDTLPEKVEHYRFENGAYTFVERFEPTCPGLHGSASTERHTVYGCTDGVLVISRDAGVFSARKIAHPADMPTGARIGTLVAHPDRTDLVGLASPNLMFVIDPDTDGFRQLTWNGQRRIASAFDAHGKNWLAMDETGQVHLLDPANDWAVRAALPAASGIPDGGSQPFIESHVHEPIVYVSDPVGQRIAIIDTSNATISSQIPLNFAPGQIRWLGFGEHEHEDHDHE